MQFTITFAILATLASAQARALHIARQAGAGLTIQNCNTQNDACLGRGFSPAVCEPQRVECETALMTAIEAAGQRSCAVQNNACLVAGFSEAQCEAELRACEAAGVNVTDELRGCVLRENACVDAGFAAEECEAEECEAERIACDAA